MAEVLVEFDATIRAEDGGTYTAQACGAADERGLWHGWIEFTPADGGEPVRTPQETTQPNRPDLEYWAGGLTAAYLEGALERAVGHELPKLRERAVPVSSHFDGPAPAAPHPAVGAPQAVLNPFAVYGEGPDILRRQLAALTEDQLTNIVRAYALSDLGAVELDALRPPELIAIITSAVERQAD